MVKAIIFDVDGTLLDTERLYMEAWTRAAKERGYDLPREALLRTRAADRSVAIKVFAEYLGEGFPYHEVWRRRVEISEELFQRAGDLVKPGVKQTLAWLKENGIPAAVASSTDRDLTRSHLAHQGLAEPFQAMVGGDMAPKRKPAPDLFLLAARLLEVEPAQCVVVEDSPAGVAAAKAAGMMCVLIPDCVPANPQTTADSLAVLESMNELVPLLKTLL